jgi:hypothetical protein
VGSHWDTSSKPMGAAVRSASFTHYRTKVNKIHAFTFVVQRHSSVRAKCSFSVLRRAGCLTPPMCGGAWRPVYISAQTERCFITALIRSMLASSTKPSSLIFSSMKSSFAAVGKHDSMAAERKRSTTAGQGKRASTHCAISPPHVGRRPVVA